MAAQAADRLKGFGTSIFTEISSLAVKHGAVNLGQGFPDFPAPDFVKEAALRHIREDRNQYALSWGLPRLRAALAANWLRRHGQPIDADQEITVASGATELLIDAVLALVNPGDEVIVFEPFYDAYVPDIQMAGAIPRVVTLRLPNWRWDPAELRAAFTPETRAVILNTPHNPTGKMFSLDELRELAGLCCEHDVVVISDEVYSEITLDGARHVPIATLPGMRDRTVTIDSMGKTFSVTGWKVGWAVASPAITQALRGVHQFVTFTNAVPFQEALADVLTEAATNDFYDTLRATYTRRRDQLAAILDGVGLPTLPIQGAYFLLSDITGLGFTDDVSFCRHLCIDVGVAAIPPSAFYADPKTAPVLARFCFAKKAETIEAAAERLKKLQKRRH
ncbi:MAG TPA: methionine aminotransferase [Polyangia bacterium]|nr:methionine aminotransferase [Polyangia bacterium]